MAQEETSNRHQCCFDKLTHERQTPKAISVFPSHLLTVEEGRNHSFQPWPTHSKGGASPPFDFLNLFTKQRGTQTKRRNTLVPKKAHTVQTVTKSKDSDRPNQTQKRSAKSLQTTHSRIFSRKYPACHSHSFFSFILPHHIPLLHSERKGFCLL